MTLAFCTLVRTLRPPALDVVASRWKAPVLFAAVAPLVARETWLPCITQGVEDALVAQVWVLHPDQGRQQQGAELGASR